MFRFVRSITLTVLLSVIPFAAHATLFTLEYSGRLTDRYTPGYNFANYISGTLTFDLASAADTYNDPFYSEYRILPGATDFVTGYVTPNLGGNDDFVRAGNGYGEPDNPMPSQDAFNVYDSSILANGTKDAIFVGVEVNNLDWLFDNNVKAFSFSGAQLNDRSNVVITRGRYEVRGGESYYYPLYEAYYQLDFAKLEAVAVPVPETGSVYLLLIGGLALLIRRWQTTR